MPPFVSDTRAVPCNATRWPFSEYTQVVERVDVGFDGCVLSTSLVIARLWCRRCVAAVEWVGTRSRRWCRAVLVLRVESTRSDDEFMVEDGGCGPRSASVSVSPVTARHLHPHIPTLSSSPLLCLPHDHCNTKAARWTDRSPSIALGFLASTHTLHPLLAIHRSHVRPLQGFDHPFH
jgi:hypothetical protein